MRPGETKCVFHARLRSTADRWRTNWGVEGGEELEPRWGGLIFSWCLGSRSLECSQQALHALLDTGAHPASNRVCRRARQTRDTAGGPGIQTLLIPQLEPDTHTEISNDNYCILLYGQYSAASKHPLKGRLYKGDDQHKILQFPICKAI